MYKNKQAVSGFVFAGTPAVFVVKIYAGNLRKILRNNAVYTDIIPEDFLIRKNLPQDSHFMLKL